MRDHDADPPGEQPLGGPVHAGLGDRVHPRGRLVEDDDPRVADQDAGEGDELLLPRRQQVAARAQPGPHPVGQVGDPRRQPEVTHRPRRGVRQPAAEQGDVLLQGADEHLGALRDARHPTPQRLDVQVVHVDAPQPDRSARHVHRARHHLRQRRLARAATAHQGVGAPAHEGQVHVPQRRRALAGAAGAAGAADLVPKLQSADLEVAVDRDPVARGLLPGRAQRLHPTPRPEGVLQLR